MEQANACGRPVIAIDIPSGLNADTGQVRHPPAQYLLTITCGIGLTASVLMDLPPT